MGVRMNGCPEKMGSDRDDGRCNNEHYSMFFVDEEGTASSFQGVRDVIFQRAYSALCTRTEEATTGSLPRRGQGEQNTTHPVRRAMKHLGFR